MQATIAKARQGDNAKQISAASDNSFLFAQILVEIGRAICYDGIYTYVYKTVAEAASFGGSALSKQNMKLLRATAHFHAGADPLVCLQVGVVAHEPPRPRETCRLRRKLVAFGERTVDGGIEVFKIRP
jgi:hypothetical protein